jgi:hypothetical protein
MTAYGLLMRNSKLLLMFIIVKHLIIDLIIWSRFKYHPFRGSAI